MRCERVCAVARQQQQRGPVRRSQAQQEAAELVRICQCNPNVAGDAVMVAPVVAVVVMGVCDQQQQWAWCGLVGGPGGGALSGMLLLAAAAAAAVGIEGESVSERCLDVVCSSASVSLTCLLGCFACRRAEYTASQRALANAPCFSCSVGGACVCFGMIAEWRNSCVCSDSAFGRGVYGFVCRVAMNGAGWVCEFRGVVRHACTKQVLWHTFATLLQFCDRSYCNHTGGDCSHYQHECTSYKALPASSL